MQQRYACHYQDNNQETTSWEFTAKGKPLVTLKKKQARLDVSWKHLKVSAHLWDKIFSEEISVNVE